MTHLSRVLAAFFVAACLLTACAENETTDDAFITPSGEGGVPLDDDLTRGASDVSLAGAGDPGIPAGDLAPIYFPFDSSVITGEAIKTLKGNARWLKDNANVKIQVEGHCDERGTVEYNLALGERRANAAKDYLVRLGVDAGRLSIISYGEERPQDSGHDESAWSKNRRAAFVLLSK